MAPGYSSTANIILSVNPWLGKYVFVPFLNICEEGMTALYYGNVWQA